MNSDLEWANEFMDQGIAQQLATDINNEYAYNKNKLAGSYLFAMLNHFNFNDIKDIPIANINHKNLIVTRKKLIQQYKKLLKKYDRM